MTTKAKKAAPKKKSVPKKKAVNTGAKAVVPDLMQGISPNR